MADCQKTHERSALSHENDLSPTIDRRAQEVILEELETGRITIRDVSSVAGVSIKTVSRVLNREPHVKAETRRRVEEAISYLGFRPSMFARTLAGRRSYQIALLYDNPSPYYINEVQSGALERCGEDGYRLIFQPCVSSSPTLTSHVIGLVAEMRVDGLILTPPVGDDQALLKELRRQNIPFVRVAPGDDQGIAPAAAMDDVAAAKEMTDYLLSLGHRRIGFIVGHPAHSASWQRLEGYKLALAAKGVRVDDALIQSGMFDFASGRKAAIELLDLDPPPSAIFASNDDMAAGALAVAHERGIGVPDQLAIAGFDNTNLAEAVWPPLTTVHQPVRALAREAADLLLSGTLDTSELRLLPYEIIVRGSTAGL